MALPNHGPRNGKAGKGMSADAAPGGPDAIDSAEATNPNVTKESLGTQTLTYQRARHAVHRLIAAGKSATTSPSPSRESLVFPGFADGSAEQTQRSPFLVTPFIL